MVVIDRRFRKYAITETEHIKTMQNCCIVYSLALLVVFYKQYALIFVFPLHLLFPYSNVDTSC